MDRQVFLIIGASLFKAGACYGLWLQDDMILKMVGLFFAVGEVMSLLAKVTNGKVDRLVIGVKINIKRS